MRRTERQRKTKETEIWLSFDLDGGEVSVDTGIGFFDHMLCAFAHHARFGLSLRCKGDLKVDGHHSVEDTGIVLGLALRELLGDGQGIERFGHSYVPMDESLGFAAVDLGGRAHLQLEGLREQGMIGGYDCSLTREFWLAFCRHAAATLHLRVEGENAHHAVEALFKAAGRALREACELTNDGISSTKGALFEG